MKKATMDGNAAASYVSYAFSELAVIYPITPSSPMAEQADEWANENKQNLFGKAVKVVEMQSEAGAAGALHGALSCGVLSTTYTCSQGLLLMLPNMYKIAGELLPTVFHVSARALATHALSIFGDHQDVMACRQTGFAFLCAASVQEVMDFALAAHLTTLKTSVPFVHFFDGFRTSHELTKIDVIEYEEMRALVNEKDIEEFRRRALDSDKPLQRGTAQNPDTYFQNRERANARYFALPFAMQQVFDEMAKITKRAYHVFDYCGDEGAENVILTMGSSAVTAEQTSLFLNAQGQKTGVIKVRLYRPFHSELFCAALPRSCKRIAVLDRTKEAGALGEPLYLDVCAALQELGRTDILVVGGRYGLGQKEFTPTQCLAVFKNLTSEQPKNHFTVGICDDVTHTSLPLSTTLSIEPSENVRCIFYGLGSDGTVGANKNSIRIIGDYTSLFVQAYFCYDSKKSGGVTISHLRFGKTPIHAPYLIDEADFIACHNPSYVSRYDMLAKIRKNGTVLLNCPHTTLQALNAYLPPSFKQIVAKKRLKLYVIDGTKIANELGLRGRHSTIMQAAFFLLNPTLMPYERATALLKEALVKKFTKKGEAVVRANLAAIDSAKDAVMRVEYPAEWENATEGATPILGANNEYFQRFISPILHLKGDELPVSAFREDGSVPTGTTKYEKHGVAFLMPQWIPQNCIQCNQCAFVCPHACIRPVAIDENEQVPELFTTVAALGLKNAKFRIQVAAHDCMGCGVCANVCPAKEKALVMRPATELMPAEGKNWEFAENVQRVNTDVFKRDSIKGSQFFQPLFEFSYACSGCGETPYIKLLTQLFGERMIIANATGCSSIYGGSSPTCPYTVNADGSGPAWANSLFEDNAEFGLGMRLAWDIRGNLAQKADENKSVWIIGGDGWAYDIGYGGLDHVLASGSNVNILVLDSEVYSNTGGQASKATPLGAVARFAAAGKRRKKKDLGLMAMTYGYVYVAQVAMGANKQQLLSALIEAEHYDGPSRIIAYSPCIAHGVNMERCMEEERLAVECGYWQLYRFNPTLKEQNGKPFTLDSKPPTKPLREFLLGENRFAALLKSQPDIAEELFTRAEQESRERVAFYQRLTALFNRQEE